MKTLYILAAQYNTPVVPLSVVCRDHFQNLEVEVFLRKVGAGKIKLPVVRMDPHSQKGARGVHLEDLARYIDERREAAVKEMRQLAG